MVLYSVPCYRTKSFPPAQSLQDSNTNFYEYTSVFTNRVEERSGSGIEEVSEPKSLLIKEDSRVRMLSHKALSILNRSLHRRCLVNLIKNNSTSKDEEVTIGDANIMNCLIHETFMATPRGQSGKVPFVVPSRVFEESEFQWFKVLQEESALSS
ncbi:hypothetical protein Scep_025504 [Stephania cephalantha]|uniref:Uncharacterized protein n=1 Tax=Stephania cephalantha TaxID=152367 RepID=A0AAP0HSI0_9MAGN